MVRKPDRPRTTFCSHHHQGISVPKHKIIRTVFVAQYGSDVFCSGNTKNPSRRERTLKDSFKLNRICNLPTGGQGAICFLPFLLALRRVINSLLLREKVAAVRLTDEESLLVGTPHPPLSRSPFPHRGRLFLYTLKAHLFFLTTTDLIKDTKAIH